MVIYSISNRMEPGSTMTPGGVIIFLMFNLSQEDNPRLIFSILWYGLLPSMFTESHIHRRNGFWFTLPASFAVYENLSLTVGLPAGFILYLRGRLEIMVLPFSFLNTILFNLPLISPS